MVGVRQEPAVECMAPGSVSTHTQWFVEYDLPK